MSQRKLPREPYIISLVDAEVIRTPGKPGAEACLVMELCPGGSLADVINSRVPANLGGLPEKQVVQVLWQVATAVSKLHSLSPPIVHRDIKAENVLIAQDGSTYKLCDFGSCQEGRLLPDSDRARNMIQEQIERYTTLAYRSPEMLDLWMEKAIDTKADVWALGCLLYKCCFLLLPFEDGTSRLAILNAKLEFPASQAAAYSPQLLQLIRTILQPDPDLRPDVWVVLQHLAAIKGVAAPSAPPALKSSPSTPHKAAHLPSSSSSQLRTPQTTTAQGFMSALDWEGGGSGSGTSTPTPTPSTPNVMDDDFFAEMPSSHSASAQSAAVSSSFVFDFGAQSEQPLSSSQGSISASSEVSWASFDEPAATPAATTDEYGAIHDVQSTGDASRLQVAMPPPHRGRRPSAGVTLSHRRSVSDSHAIFDGSATEPRQLAQFRTAMSPEAHFMALLRQEAASSASLVVSAVALQARAADPSFLTLRQWLVLSWARFGGDQSLCAGTVGSAGTNPDVALLLFDSIQRELAGNLSVTSTSAMLWLRFAQEASPAFLRLLISRKEQLSNASASLPENSWQRLLGNVLLAKLELHRAVPELEGSLSLDVYFRTLRDQQLKLKIGGSSSPLRRQTCTLLIQLAEAVGTALDAIFKLSPQHVSSDWLEFVLSSLVSEEWACLLLLQYLLVKLLATKADLSAEELCYRAVFEKLYTHVTRTKMSCPQMQPVLPQLPAVPPAIDRGSTTQLPPSLHPCFALNASMLPHHLVPDHVPILKDPGLLGLFKQIAHEGAAGQPTAAATPAIHLEQHTPFFSVASAPLPALVPRNPLSHSQPSATAATASAFDPFSAPRPSTPSFDPFSTDPWPSDGMTPTTQAIPASAAPVVPALPSHVFVDAVAAPAVVSQPHQQLLAPPPGARRPSSAAHRRVASSGAAFQYMSSDFVQPSHIPDRNLQKEQQRRSQPRETSVARETSPAPAAVAAAPNVSSASQPPALTSEQKLANSKQVDELHAELKALQSADPDNAVCADCGGTWC